MLSEWLHYITGSRCSTVRKLGYLKESIAIPGRHKRCKKAWQPHLHTCKETIVTTMSKCSSTETALILGSGHLLDVPLEQLACRFKKVILVDIVQPHSVRRIKQTYPNVILEEWDITEIAATILSSQTEDDHSFPQSTPRRFLEDSSISFVVSLNLLSQIPIPFARHLLASGISEAQVATYCQHLVKSHLTYIHAFNAIHCVISDLKHLTYDKHGNETDSYDALYGITMPPPQKSWLWHIAPLGELDKNYMHKNLVGCFTNA